MQKTKQMSTKRERQNLKQDLGPCGPFPSRQAFSPYKRDQLQYPNTLYVTLLKQTQGLESRSITYCEGTSQENIPGFSSGHLGDLSRLTVGHCFLTTLMEHCCGICYRGCPRAPRLFSQDTGLGEWPAQRLRNNECYLQRKRWVLIQLPETLVVLPQMEKIHITHFFIAFFSLLLRRKSWDPPKQKQKQANKNPC